VITGRAPTLRFQCQFRFATPFTRDIARLQNSRVCHHLHGDRQVTNASRLMRLPGLIAWPKPDKPGRVVELTEFILGDNRLYEPEEFLPLPPLPDFRSAHTFSDDGTAIPDELKAADPEALAALVRQMPSNGQLERDDWINTGYAIRGAFADRLELGRTLFIEWSLKWPGNRAKPLEAQAGAETVWESFKNARHAGERQLLDHLGGAGIDTASYRAAAAQNEFSADMTMVAEAPEAPAPSPVPSDGDLLAINPQTPYPPPRFSEEHLALSFANVGRENIRFVDPWGHWMIFDGMVWRRDEKRIAFRATREICRHAAQRFEAEGGDGKDIKDLAKRKTSYAVHELAKSAGELAASTDQWDADKDLLNTPGGVVDLKTGKIRPHSHLDYCSKITAVAPGGECPKFLKFMSEIMSGDQEMVDYLQRVFGYAITGHVKEQELFFFWGVGGNGKGTLLNLMTKVFGDYAVTAPGDMFLETNGERHRTEIARLRGARLVTAQEVGKGRKWDETKIKELTGGDPITANFMRHDPFTFDPQFALFVGGNDKPALRSVNHAMRRRVRLVAFLAVFGKPEQREQGQGETDTDLSDTLFTEEAGGILAWLIEGARLWYRDRLRPPKRVMESTDDYLSGEGSLISQWFRERCETKLNANTSTTTLSADYREWHMARIEAEKAEGQSTTMQLGDILNHESFLREVKGLGHAVGPHNGRSVFRTIKLRDAPKPVS
jgi:putative DNA primase/helicase